MKYLQCFICREWSWDVCKILRKDVHLCLPCYVDVLEVKHSRDVNEARGSMGEPSERSVSKSHGVRSEATIPGSAPSPYVPGDLFEPD